MEWKPTLYKKAKDMSDSALEKFIQHNDTWINITSEVLQQSGGDPIGMIKRYKLLLEPFKTEKQHREDAKKAKYGKYTSGGSGNPR